MFRFLLLISVFLLTTNAQAHWGTSKEALIEQVEKLGDEVADYDHEQIYLKYTYFWLKNTNRLLNLKHMQNRMRVPSQVTDEHLMQLMQQVVRKLERRRRLYFFQKFYVKYILQYLMIQLKTHRVNLMLLAQLEISGDNPFMFGVTATGLRGVSQFTISNVGDGAATQIISSISGVAFDFENGTPPSGNNGTCESSLGAGEECIIFLEFNAPELPGLYDGNLRIDYHNGSHLEIVEKKLLGEAV